MDTRGGTSASGSPSLEVEDLWLTRGRRDVLRGVSLAAHPASVLGLLGANGAGKSSLLKVCTGLVAATGGRVRAFGNPVPPRTLPPHTGALIEEPRFYPYLSARGNLEVVAAGRSDHVGRIDEMLEQADLLDAAQKPVAAFSQGMRQRLGIARALLGNPQVLILDEPTNGLDPQGFRWVRELIVKKRSEGCAVVLASHVLSEAQLLSDWVAVIADGQLVAHGVTDQLLGDSRSLEDLFFALAQ